MVATVFWLQVTDQCGHSWLREVYVHTDLAVGAWLVPMTRLESRFLVALTRLESHWKKWWLDSSHVFHKMTRPESHSMTHFYKISEFLMDKPSSFAHKEMRIFCFSDDQHWGNFLFWLFSCAMLHTCVKAGLRLCFHWGSVGAQYIDTLSWFNVVYAYHHHGSGSHTVTLCLFQIPIKWFKFFRFKSKPKLYCKI